MDGGKIVLAHLKLTRMRGNEVGGGHGLGEFRDEEGGEGDVEREEGLDTMSHVEGGVASGLADGGAVSPEDIGCAARAIWRGHRCTL